MSIKSLSTKQTGPKAKIELKSEIPALNILNMTAKEGKILDKQTSWSKVTHRYLMTTLSQADNISNFNVCLIFGL